MNLSEFICGYYAKIIENTNNLFKHQFLMHPDNILCKINVVESSYEIFNL
jgi:hypothetical protein